MSACARCGAAFGCAMADGGDGAPCWCTRLPAVVPVPADGTAAGCWCPACLEQHIALREGPSPSMPPGKES
ncbi:cysteine-rich CWC family protein [uncultured Massilia sp.]|uniref:cysteine-rich CWC family protein n=1 Tax=uncultured Massilia sp. TaxID=169973 RepID=UPI0025FB5400|nr:cysteine-rich CWC family protein [uncultured Massilia sp.]